MVEPKDNSWIYPNGNSDEFIRRNAIKENAINDIKSDFDDGMSVEEQYRVIFDWCVNNFNYAYSGLNYAYAEQEIALERDNNLAKFYRQYCMKMGVPRNFLSVGTRKQYISDVKDDPNVPVESIQHSEKVVALIEKTKELKLNENGYVSGDSETTWTSKFGVCQNFADIYQFLCKKFGLPCESVYGSIDSGDYNVGHVWNAILIDGELKHVDVSGAIHCKDGTNTRNSIDDFFGKSFDELQKIDGGVNRRISRASMEHLEKFASRDEGHSFGE